MGDSDCAVIGGGITGAAIAAALAQSGKSVTQFDAAHCVFPPTTSFSFGWINAHSPHHQHHFQMRLESMKPWRAFKSSFPGLPVYERVAKDRDFHQAGETRFAQRQSLDQDMTIRLRSLLPWIEDAAVLHCAITLAPWIARLICKQVENECVLRALRPCSISRFAPGHERIAS